jgi:hypothetical protein
MWKARADLPALFPQAVATLSVPNRNKLTQSGPIPAYRAGHATANAQF